jgi:hypothetical protein
MATIRSHCRFGRTCGPGCGMGCIIAEIIFITNTGFN